MAKTFEEIMAELKTGTFLSGAYQVDSGKIDENTGVPIPKRICVMVSFAEQGYGFGEIVLVAQDGKLFVDGESTEKEHLGVILGRLLDNAIFDLDEEPEKHRAWSEAMGRSCGPTCELHCDCSSSAATREALEQRPAARITWLEENLKTANEAVAERDRTIAALRAEIASTMVDTKRASETANLVGRMRHEIASTMVAPESAGFEFTKKEKELLQANNKLEAIKSVRARLGVDLVTAKRLCDRF